MSNFILKHNTIILLHYYDKKYMSFSMTSVIKFQIHYEEIVQYIYQ